MSRRHVIFDVTRLTTRFSRPTPNGIDRVDLGYARHFLSEARGGHGALFGPVGLRAIDNQAARRVVDAVAAHWQEDGRADDDDAHVRLVARLSSSELSIPRHTPGRRRTSASRSIGGLLRGGNILGRTGLFPGRRLVGALPEGSVYLNVSQFPLWLDWYFRWMDRRPDMRSAFFIHDLLPITHPEFFPAAEARRHAARLDVLARRGNGVIVASDETRTALEQHFRSRGKAQPSVGVIPLPVSGSFADPAPEIGIALAKPYFVCLGTIEPRKNHLLLLNIWRELAERLGDRTPTLLLVGARGWDNENVLDMIERCSAIRPHIIEVSGLSTPALKRIMAGARGVLLPTLAEGFGLPVDEARAAGAPMIISSVLAARAPADGLTTALDPLDGLGWRDAILSHAFSASPPNRLATPRSAPTPQSWALHIEHVERFIQSL